MSQVSDILVAIAKLSSRKAPATRPARKSVLCVEDTDDVLESLVALIQSWGFQTLAAKDGASAIHLAMAEQPKIILSDLKMPGISGFEFARFVRRQSWGQETKLIAISGWGGQDTRQAAFEAGFDYFFQKPAEISELYAVLNQPKRNEDPKTHKIE